MRFERVGDILVKHGRLDPSDLDLCLAVQQSSLKTDRVGVLLKEYRFVDEHDVALALAEQAGCSFFDGDYVPEMDVVQALGVDFFKQKCVFPLSGKGGFSFVIADGSEAAVVDMLRVKYGRDVTICVGLENRIMTALEKINSSQAIKQNIVQPVVRKQQEPDLPAAVQAVIDHAISIGATDIHIEPSDRAVEVRLRIDGVLHFHRSFTREELGRVVNVLFNRADINSGDFLRFHDARFECRHGGRAVDVRLSHIPSVNGPSVVLRLLEKARSAQSLEKLGYAKEHREAIGHALQKPHGLILLTGPTGCGKTTSLYAMLQQLHGIETKIVTAEDPVEVRMPLITQVVVDAQKGHDFPDVTRAALRHDPDVVLVGEVRDATTAREAVRAAVTGHRVLSTLHTNDAPGAVLRLKDLGIDYAHIANTLVGVVAQRLVRMLCPLCKKERHVTSKDISGAEAKYLDAVPGLVFSPCGCPSCFEGFKGRTVVAEIFLMDDESRFLIEQGLIHEVALKLKERPGFLSMTGNAKRLVQEGVLSLCEAVRVLG